jgi:lipoprotein-anchoring transpeptidase ErfK/SrfK
VVAFDKASYTPGSIIVRTPERALYYVLPEGQAIRYRVGVGREGFQWSGTSSIVRKEEWPSWTPPQRMIEREAAKGITIPAYMEGGPKNPLGARALYIGGTLYRIHGTNNARTIGGAVSSGCIRMLNRDVVDLYDRVKVGARVYVYQ